MATHGYPVTKQMKAERQKRAAEMKASYDQLSLKQKMDKLEEHCRVFGGNATKQRARLEKQMTDAERQAASPKKEPTTKK